MFYTNKIILIDTDTNTECEQNICFDIDEIELFYKNDIDQIRIIMKSGFDFMIPVAYDDFYNFIKMNNKTFICQ